MITLFFYITLINLLYFCGMKRYFYLIAIIIYIILSLVLIVFLSGCGQSHFYKQAEKFHFKHSDICDSEAVKWYPVQIKNIEVKKYLPGIPTIKTMTDTVYSARDSFAHDTDFQIHTKSITESDMSVRVDTLKITDSITTIDSKGMALANDKVNKVQKENDILHSGINIWRWWALIEAGLILLVVGLKALKIL